MTVHRGQPERTPPQPLPQGERGSERTGTSPPSFLGKGVGGLGFFLWSIVASLCLALTAHGQLVTPTTEVAPSSVRLSETVRVTLAVEGPAPLGIDFPTAPAEVLAEESRKLWRIQPASPVTVTPLSGGRERWVRAFRLAPYAAGEAVPLVFAPVKVTTGADPTPQEVIWPAKEIRVVTTVVDPRPENVRPITGIEQLPPPPVAPPEVVGWKVLAGLGGVFATVLILAIVRKWRAKPPPLLPAAWAAGILARLGRDLGARTVEAGDVPQRVAAVLREYVERRHGVPAPKQTTSELVAGCEQAGWPSDRTAPLRDILERCDWAKFAGEPLGIAQAEEVINRAGQWVASSEPSASPDEK